MGNMKNKRIFTLLIPLLMTACAESRSVQITTQEHLEHVQIPTTGILATANIGETLFENSIIRSSPGIRLKDTYNTEWMRAIGTRAWPFTFQQGTILGKISEVDGVSIYTGKAIGGMQTGDGQQLGAPYGLGITPDGNVRYVYAFDHVILESPNKYLGFEKKDITTPDSGNTKQEFIYSGRNGTVLYFIYREFMNDLARPAFTQNVQYDLKEGNIVGFKSLRILVKSARNTTVDYQIDHGF